MATSNTRKTSSSSGRSGSSNRRQSSSSSSNRSRSQGTRKRASSQNAVAEVKQPRKRRPAKEIYEQQVLPLEDMQARADQDDYLDYSLKTEIKVVGFVVVMAFLFLCNIMPLGALGKVLSDISFGLFGVTAYIMPVAIAAAVVLYISNFGSRAAIRKIVSGMAMVLIIGIVAELIAGRSQGLESYSISEIFIAARDNRNGGGVIAGSISYLMYKLLSMIGTVLALIAMMVASIVVFTEKSVLKGVKKGSKKAAQKAKEEARRARENADYHRQEMERKREIRRRREEEARERAMEEHERKRQEAELAQQQAEDEKILRMEKKVSGVMMDTKLSPDTEDDTYLDDYDDQNMLMADDTTDMPENPDIDALDHPAVPPVSAEVDDVFIPEEHINEDVHEITLNTLPVTDLTQGREVIELPYGAIQEVHGIHSDVESNVEPLASVDSGLSISIAEHHDTKDDSDDTVVGDVKGLPITIKSVSDKPMRHDAFEIGDNLAVRDNEHTSDSADPLESVTHSNNHEKPDLGPIVIDGTTNNSFDFSLGSDMHELTRRASTPSSSIQNGLIDDSQFEAVATSVETADDRNDSFARETLIELNHYEPSAKSDMHEITTPSRDLTHDEQHKSDDLIHREERLDSVDMTHHDEHIELGDSTHHDERMESSNSAHHEERIETDRDVDHHVQTDQVAPTMGTIPVPNELKENAESDHGAQETYSDSVYTSANRDMNGSYSVHATDYIAPSKKTETYQTPQRGATIISPGMNKAINESLAKDHAPVKKEYVFPPLDLLNHAPASRGLDTKEQLQATAQKLEDTLKTFGVSVKVTDISKGPAVTRYEITPDAGVRVNKIVNLADDIKLALAASDIRIEAPIPGKAAVGIEVPNKEISMVAFRELIDSDAFRSSKANLTFGVGKDIAGKVVVSDINKMPHLLIAGATGSGKSVCINTIIMSLMYKSKPEDVKMIMIDPKIVELSVYNGIPHLLIPVVTDPKKAAAALSWAVMEMTNRYKKFAEVGVRDMAGYNDMLIKEGRDAEKMPSIVVIVDELADLMMVSANEVEDAICRLTQLARAAGIHLIIATQRPSVDVITGLIKANIPSRIAFAVSSAVDSRTILDIGGAEKLLGKGDMLFFPRGFNKPDRVQGAFVSDDEVKAVTDFVKNQGIDRAGESEIEKQISKFESASANSKGGNNSSQGASDDPADDRDEYFEKAGLFIIEKEKASIGMLQRIFKIGFNRAARIMDQLCEAGVVGDEEGTKPRKILMTKQEFEDMLYAGADDEEGDEEDF